MNFVTGLLVNKFLGPVVRHGATIAGGWLIQEGYADESTAQAIQGGIVAAGGIALSFAEKFIRQSI